MQNSKISKGWIVTYAALGVNLVLGLLYTWGVFQKALVDQWQWSSTTASLPYSVAIAVFAFMMIFAGRAQDKIGPRYVAILGGIMLGLGLIASGLTTNPIIMVFTFGVVGACGIGLGYSATTPCAIKWFGSSKRGLISGIVVAGVGLAPVYIAPLTNYLIKAYGIQQTFIILGVFAIVAVVLFSLLLKNPPAGYAPAQAAVAKKVTISTTEIPWNAMMKTNQFYLLWFMYLLSATAGLMLIGHLPKIASTQAGWKAGYYLVVVLSIFNAAGRVLIGSLSDKIGRTSTMIIVFLLQAANMFIFTFYNSIPLLILGAALAGLAYGALFTLFPTTTADFFGVKNLGVNYGLVFTGWGIAGIIGPIVGGMVKDATGSYSISYIIAGVLLLIGVVMVRFIKPMKPKANT
jgi:MFS transporter, OFA family, oxalate/formate antiporter